MARQSMTVEERAKQTVGEAETCRLAIEWVGDLRAKAKEAGASGMAALPLIGEMLRVPRTRKSTPREKPAKAGK